MKTWAMAMVREKLIRIGAEIVCCVRSVILQIFKVEIPGKPFFAILDRDRHPRAVPSMGPS